MFADGTMWLKDLRVKNDSMFAGSLSSPMFASGFPNGTGWMLAPYIRTNAAGINETRYKLGSTISPCGERYGSTSSSCPSS